MAPARLVLLLLLSLLAALRAAEPRVAGLAVPGINMSLATIPTGYFGGSGLAPRPDADIQALAQQRVIVIEKWEGPCWDDCIANSSQTPPVPCSPSCFEEDYQLATLRRVKALNPAVSGVFYLNSLYDFPYTNLCGRFAAADLHVRDVNGAVIGIQNDNGMLHIPLFDFSKPKAVTMFLDFHRQLLASGAVDGTFADKPNERAFRNTTNGLWYICENPNGPSRKHSWADACGQITEATALAYNAGKESMLRQLVDLYGESGALWPVCSEGVTERCGSVCSRTPECSLSMGSKTHQQKHAEIVEVLKNYTYIFFMMGDSGTNDYRSGSNRTMACGCTPADVVQFLLTLESGAILGPPAVPLSAV